MQRRVSILGLQAWPSYMDVSMESMVIGPSSAGETRASIQRTAEIPQHDQSSVRHLGPARRAGSCPCSDSGTIVVSASVHPAKARVDIFPTDTQPLSTH